MEQEQPKTEINPFGTEQWFDGIFNYQDDLTVGVRERLQTISTASKLFAKTLYATLPSTHTSKVVIDEVVKVSLLANLAVLKSNAL